MDEPALTEPDFPTPEVMECPYPSYAALRSDDPVHRLQSGRWLVTRWEDVMSVVTDTETFSSAIGPLSKQILGGPRVGGDNAGPWPLPFTDGEVHRRQRKLAARLVSRRRLDWFKPVISGLCDDLIDDFIEAGEVEFRSAFAEPLPRRVMMAAYGLPGEDEGELVRLTTGPGIRSKLEVARRPETPTTGRGSELRARSELGEYFHRHIVDRAAHPTDDFLSELISTQVEHDGAIDLSYLVAEVSGLFTGGFLTTAHLLASMMLLLVQHPSELEILRNDRSLLRSTMEEALRLESPVQFLQRIVTKDTVLGGRRLRAGSVILLCFGSANRDGEAFEDPDRFWIDRHDVKRLQMGFGSGVHTCVGAPLARLESAIAFNKLLDRLDGLRIASWWHAHATHTKTSLNQRAPDAVHIEFDPPWATSSQ